MEIKDFLILLLPPLSAVLGYYLSKRKELRIQLDEERRKRYEALISLLKQGFMASNLSDEDKIKRKESFLEESYVVWLYASDDVIKRVNDFIIKFVEFDRQRTIEANRSVNIAFQNLIFAMRKDINSHTKLMRDDFTTVTLT
jgi:hypothetical protein